MPRKSRMLDNVEALIELCLTEPSQASVLRKMGYTNSPGNYRTLHRVADQFNIVLPDGTGTQLALASTTLSLEAILVENSSYGHGQNLKRRLLKAGLLEDKCYNIECSLKSPFWLGKRIVFQLEHINGNRRDNRIENLELLCPNCHSQTETFCKGLKWRKI